MARRYLVDPLPAAGVTSRLPDTVGRGHLQRVLRVREGDSLLLFDGRGHECGAQVVYSGRDGVDVLATAAVAATREPAIEVTLLCAIPKGNRGDWIFEHGTEVGVRHFWPVVSERSHPGAGGGPAPDRQEKRLERWRRIVEAAAGQCDRAWIPSLRPPAPLLKALTDPELPDERCYAGMTAARAIATAASAAVAYAVGPEGGFTPDEESALRAAGFSAVTLGPLTLRAETAAVVGAFRLFG